MSCSFNANTLPLLSIVRPNLGPDMLVENGTRGETVDWLHDVAVVARNTPSANTPTTPIDLRGFRLTIFAAHMSSPLVVRTAPDGTAAGLRGGYVCEREQVVTSA